MDCAKTTILLNRLQLCYGCDTLKDGLRASQCFPQRELLKWHLAQGSTKCDFASFYSYMIAGFIVGILWCIESNILIINIMRYSSTNARNISTDIRDILQIGAFIGHGRIAKEIANSMIGLS